MYPCTGTSTQTPRTCKYWHARAHTHTHTHACLVSCASVGLVSCASTGLVSCASAGLVSCASAGLESCVSAGLVSCTSAGLVSCASAGLVSCASVGLVSCASVGLVSCASAGLVSCASAGLVSCTSAGLVSCASAGLVSCASAGLVSCATLLVSLVLAKEVPLAGLGKHVSTLCLQTWGWWVSVNPDWDRRLGGRWTQQSLGTPPLNADDDKWQRSDGQCCCFHCQVYSFVTGASIWWDESSWPYLEARRCEDCLPKCTGE